MGNVILRIDWQMIYLIKKTNRTYFTGQFLHMAQGSLSELDTHLEISLRLDYIKETFLQEVSIIMNDIDKMLTGLIKSLKR